MRPSAVMGKMSTPPHSSLRPSTGCVARAVHSLTAKSSPHRKRPALEAQRRAPREDDRDVGAHGGGARDSLPGAVVVEDDRVVVHRRNRVEVLRVSGRVVAVDQGGDLHEQILPFRVRHGQAATSARGPVLPSSDPAWARSSRISEERAPLPAAHYRSSGGLARTAARGRWPCSSRASVRTASADMIASTRER
jgi:hypothetical protein